MKILLDHVAPAVAEKLGARQMHKTQFDDTPPARDTSGAVRAPIPEGTGVSAGRRQK